MFTAGVLFLYYAFKALEHATDFLSQHQYRNFLVPMTTRLQRQEGYAQSMRVLLLQCSIQFLVSHV